MAKVKQILRTVYIPLKMDAELSQMGFWVSKSKNDLIRQFVKEGLKRWKKPEPLKILEKNSKKK